MKNVRIELYRNTVSVMKILKNVLPIKIKSARNTMSYTPVIHGVHLTITIFALTVVRLVLIVV